MGKNGVQAIFGHTSFGHNSAIFGPTVLKFFMAAQDPIKSINWC